MKEKKSEIRPIGRISPSKYTATQKCAYRVVLAASTATPPLPYPPAIHLGNIIHKITELITIGKITNIEDFENTWQKLLSTEENMLIENGLPSFVPLSANVPGYTIKKLQARSRLRNVTPPAEGFTNQNVHIQTEKWLQSTDSLIGGSIDLIITKNQHTKLCDLKTGIIFSEDGQIKEDYQQQLRLYAYLYAENQGHYPDEITIIDLSNQEYQITFTPDQCRSLAGSAKEMLLTINNSIKEKKWEALAQPEISQCSQCLYRSSCDFYWPIVSSNTKSLFKDIKGHLVSFQQFRSGDINVTIEQGGTRVQVSHLNSGNLELLTNSIGKEISVYNIKQYNTEGKYQATKTTRIYES